MKTRTTTKTIGNAATLTAILDKLGAEKLEPRQPDEFTTGDVMRDRGWSVIKAQRFLSDCARRGILTRRRFGAEYLYRAVG
jgi:hypothetical protein